MREIEELIENSKGIFFQLILQQLEKGQIGFEFIQEEIKLLFHAIKHTQNAEEADLIFDNLQVIQLVLAKAVFVNGAIVTPFLRDFIYDYERIDDVEYKEYLYKKIKASTS